MPDPRTIKTRTQAVRLKPIALRVACPACGAGIGLPCHTYVAPSGFSRQTQPHADRVKRCPFEKRQARRNKTNAR